MIQTTKVVPEKSVPKSFREIAGKLMMKSLFSVGISLQLCLNWNKSSCLLVPLAQCQNHL